VYALRDLLQTRTRLIPRLREAHGGILTDGETMDAPITIPYDGPRLAPLRGHAEREAAWTFIKPLDAAGSRRRDGFDGAVGQLLAHGRASFWVNRGSPECRNYPRFGATVCNRRAVPKSANYIDSRR